MTQLGWLTVEDPHLCDCHSYGNSLCLSVWGDNWRLASPGALADPEERGWKAGGSQPTLSQRSPSVTCPSLSQPLVSPLEPLLCCSKVSPKHPWGDPSEIRTSLLTSLGSSLQPAAEGRSPSRGLAGSLPCCVTCLPSLGFSSVNCGWSSCDSHSRLVCTWLDAFSPISAS